MGCLSMSRLLVIDTSTEGCSVAVSVGTDVVEVMEIIPRGHAQRIMPMISDVMAQAQLSIKQLDGIAFGRGPGAFTGLRIAAGVVQGLAFGANLPVIPVSSLAALAQGAIRECNANFTLAAIDARMGEVYWALYEQKEGLAQLMGQEQLTKPEQVSSEVCFDQTDWMGVGTGCAYSDQFVLKVRATLVERYPRASDIAILAQDLFARGCVVSAEKAVPIYLRDNVVQKPHDAP